MDLGKAIQKSIDLYLKNFGVLFLAGLLVAILSAVTIGIIAGPLIAGFIVLVMKLDRGEKAEVGEIFAHFDKFVPTLLIAIICLVIPMIIGLIPIIGLLFGIIAGPIINLIFYAAIAFTVEKNIEPVEAIKKGYACFMTNPGMNWVYSFVISLLSGVGVVACIIGVILTIPIGTIGMTIAYQELSAKVDNAAGPSVQA